MEANNYGFIGGVHNAYEGRILVGPLINAELFVSLPEGSSFGDVTLPPVSYRHIVSCLPLPSTGRQDGQKQSGDGSQLDMERRDVVQHMQSANDFIAKLKEKRASLVQQKSSEFGGMTEAQLANEAAIKKVAEDNQRALNLAKKTLGEDHCWTCIVEEAKEENSDEIETAAFLSECLDSDPKNVVYVYSESGKNRASCLALYFLQKTKQIPLGDLLKALPLCTPYIRHLVAFMNNDQSSVGSFNADGFWFSYFCRRYNNLKESDVRAAMETCPNDYLKIDRLLNEQSIFLATREKKL